uniref:Uncharacterized protein n=1 Tax=Nelumbo nucifera TaxID=4432 RepID=A0A822Y293_NELNU|nr:TPA_asm: hypothetical protein HUJ06_028208 [Nelumbo nucifera]DAD26741.1 TPA_asm: hypothetical protein HUJ06_028209 [Nelumbo nucifera]
MVAISLYRGNLHRTPDVPRRWLMPIPRISLKDFRILLRKREKALSCISSTTAPTSSNPNPNPDFKQEEGVGDSGCSKQNGIKLCLASEPQSQPTIARNSEDAPSQHGIVEHAKDHNEADCDPRAKQSRELGGSIGVEKPFRGILTANESDDLYLTTVNFVSQWLPTISGQLKSLAISDFWIQSCWRRSEVLSLIAGDNQLKKFFLQNKH